eukprot:m.173358 g.173358  ORF g.173358 m.173358 type:complete len:320 (+) comp18299_c2_seq3:130-1089(+)
MRVSVIMSVSVSVSVSSREYLLPSTSLYVRVCLCGGLSQVDPVGTNLFIPSEEKASLGRHHQKAPRKFESNAAADHLQEGIGAFVNAADEVGTNLFMPAEEIATGGRHHEKKHRRFTMEDRNQFAQVTSGNHTGVAPEPLLPAASSHAGTTRPQARPGARGRGVPPSTSDVYVPSPDVVKSKTPAFRAKAEALQQQSKAHEAVMSPVRQAPARTHQDILRHSQGFATKPSGTTPSRSSTAAPKFNHSNFSLGESRAFHGASTARSTHSPVAVSRRPPSASHDMHFRSSFSLSHNNDSSARFNSTTSTVGRGIKAHDFGN